MKRNWIVIVLMSLLTAGLWAQAAATSTPQTADKSSACACCNHQANADGAAMNDCCGGKDAKACSRKDGKGCCSGMKGMKAMKKDAAQTTTAAAASCGKDCCGKDCCKDGKCEMAKNGKKCCDHCAGMAEGK